MISSTSSSNKCLALLLLGLAVLAGCVSGKEAARVEPHSVAGLFRIAVLPVENLSGAGGAQAKQLREALLERLAGAGVTLLGDDLLDQFMARHRIRHLGGIDTATAKAFLEETGTNAVLVTSLELYNETDPPRIALFSRMVSTGDFPEIIWMDGVGMAGDDSPGILDLGLIHDPRVLRDNALDVLVDSLLGQLAGEAGRPGAAGSSRTFRPKMTFDASFLQRGKRYTIGVLPFINLSGRNHAGEIMALQFVRQLSAMDDFIVLEPGVVRERLLNLRIIMAEGISKVDLDVISNSLGTDLMLAGKVNSYQDLNAPGGVPKVEFSVLLMEGGSERIVWSSTSYNEGDDRVFFFDAGRLSTALETAARMVRSLLAQIERSAEPPGKEVPGEIVPLQLFRGKP